MDTNLLEILTKRLIDLAEKDSLPLFARRDLVTKVVRGVDHCEEHMLEWRAAATSYRHTVAGEFMSAVLAFSEQQQQPSVRVMREKLHLADNIKSDELGLPLDNPYIHIDAQQLQRILMYLWVNAALIVKEEVFEAWLRHRVAEPQLH